MHKTKLSAISSKPKSIPRHLAGQAPLPDDNPILVDGFPRLDDHSHPDIQGECETSKIRPTQLALKQSALRRINGRAVNAVVVKSHPNTRNEENGTLNTRDQISRSLDEPTNTEVNVPTKLDKIEEHRKLSRLPRNRVPNNKLNGRARRKSSHEMLSNATAAPKLTDSENVYNTVHELVIGDEEKAKANDRIIQDRVNEAKALNRRNEDGANMHAFSLWSKKSKPSLVSKDDSEDSHDIAPPKRPSRNMDRSFSPSMNQAYAPPADYIIGLPEEEERPLEDHFKSKGGRMAELLRQAVAASNVSDTDSLGSHVKYTQSNESAEEVEDLYSRQNEVDSICSIEEEEEIRGLPVRRRSYSEGELGALTRHFSCEEIQNFGRYRSPSPALSEISRESIEVTGAVSLAVSKAVSSDDNGIDFSDSTMKWYGVLN